jgi:hypothetical protein
MGQQFHREEQDTKPEFSNKNPKTITIILTGCKNVGKSTIFKQFEFLFWNQKVKTIRCSSEHMKLYFKDHCRENIIIHFKSAFEIFNKNRPTYDAKTENILNSILAINVHFFNFNSFWSSDVANVISKVSQEEKFQEILKDRHKYNLGDSTDYLLKRVNYFNEEAATKRMDYLRFEILFFLNGRCLNRSTGINYFSFEYKDQLFEVIDTGFQYNLTYRFKKIFSEKKNPVVIHVCALSQYNEKLDDDNSIYGEYKLNKQFENLESLFNSEYIQRITNLEEITSIPFYLLFNKQDVFEEEIQKQDISCSFPDCPKELKFDKNTFPMSPRVSKKTIQKMKSFELIKQPNQELKVQDLSEDELFHIFSFLKATELCEISKVNTIFYHVSNLKNLWKNLCLKFHPDLTEEKAFLYYNYDKINLNLWKQYFIHFKMLVTKSEKFLIEKFLSVTNFCHQCNGS